jgi:YD repeat-containing protein
MQCQITRRKVYDAAGNQEGVPGATYQYDGASRIKTVDGGSTATYAYDGDGRRVKKVAAGVTTWYLARPRRAARLVVAVLAGQGGCRVCGEKALLTTSPRRLNRPPVFSQTLPAGLPQLKDGCLALFVEPDNVVATGPQESRDLGGGAVTAPNPYELRRCSTQNGKPVGVFVLTYEHAMLRPREVPHRRVRSAALTEPPNVKRSRETVGE